MSDILLAGIVFSFLFSMRLANGFIILYAFNWLIGNNQKTWNLQKTDWVVLLLMLPWLWEAGSLLYTTDIHEGLKQLEKKIPLTIFPFIILHHQGGRLARRDNLFLALTGSVIAVTLFCLIDSTARWIQTGKNTFFWFDLTKVIDFHPTYLSLIINIICIWIWLTLITKKDEWSLQKKIGAVLELIGFGVITILLSSKIQTVIYFAITVVGSFSYYGNLNWKLIIGLVGVGLMLGAIFANKKVKERFMSIDTYSYRLDAPVSTFTEFTIRLALIEWSWMLIKERPLWGTGIGDVMSDLDSVYRKVDYKFGYLDQQDPHDQYLRIILGTGSIGLFLFISSLAVPFWLAIKSRDFMLIWFILIFGVSFLFESVLERHNGIVIYSILNSVLIFGMEGAEESPVRKVITS